MPKTLPQNQYSYTIYVQQANMEQTLRIEVSHENMLQDTGADRFTEHLHST